MAKPNGPRVLFYDIETSLQPVAVFQLANNDWIDPANLLAERYVICISWMWEGESKVHSISVLDDPKRYAKNPHDDRFVVTEFHKVLSQADIIVGHNSDSFDKKYLDTRMLVQGLPPLPPITSIDTYKVAKAKFMFNSNKLDYIGKLLKVGQKLQTSPKLWLRVMQGESSAVKEMVTYNKQDVLLLRDVYNKLKPHIPNMPNLELFGVDGCPRCGSTKIQSRGLHRAISRVYRRLQCQYCGGWFRAVVNDKAVKPQFRVV